MNDKITSQTSVNLPTVNTVLPEGHFNAGGGEYVSQADYYDNTSLKPLLVAAPIANFFNKLSATLQIVFVSTFMMLMVAIPLLCGWVAYQVATESPNYVVIKEQEADREDGNISNVPVEEAERAFRSATSN